VATLIASERDRAAGRAGALGLSWGAGHALTLFALGLPVVLFEDFLPGGVERAAELAVGLAIMALALRLLVRWRRGYFHAHVHEHDGMRHVHLHMHEHSGRAQHPARHVHAHAALGRSPFQAFAIGLVHGVGGSAGMGILLAAAIPGRVESAIALALLAAFTAVSMAAASMGFGHALSRGPVLRRAVAVTPAVAALSLAFGAWYALGALAAVPYHV
jgi:hypothetical protein